MMIFLFSSKAGAQSGPLKIMPLGDSITYGFNGINYPNGSPPGGYRRQLANRLGGAGISYDLVGNSTLNSAAGIDPDHNGYPGIRTDQALSALSGWLSVNPEVVLIHLGTNDMIQHVPIGTAINNLSTIIQQTTANAPNRRVYIATIIPIIDTRDGHTPAEWKVIVDAYNVQVRSLVQQYANQGRKVFLADMSAGLVYSDPNPANRFFQPGDGTHPGQAGYNQMGDFWFNSITGGATPPPVTGTQVLANGSFESDFTAWTRSGNQMIQASGAYAATDGTRLVAFNAGNTTPNGVIAQTFSTIPGVSYSLTFDAGVLAYNTNDQRLLVTVGGSSPLLSQVVTMSGTGNGGTRWMRQNFSFVANSRATTLTFRDQSATTAALDLLLDNVRVTGGGAVTSTAPIAVTDTYSIVRNTDLMVPSNGVLGNDTDPQSQPLTAILRSTPTNGTVSLNSNGGFTYVPASNFTGPDSFTYQASNGSQSSSVVTVSISVNAATSVGLVNGSFESGFQGWTMTGNAFIASAAPYVATHGSKLVAFNNGNLPANAVISQSFATTIGTTYTLDFDIGILAYNGSSQTLQVQVNGTSTRLSQTLPLFPSGLGIRWESRTFIFQADSNTTSLTFRDLSTSTNSLDLLLDDVNVTRP